MAASPPCWPTQEWQAVKALQRLQSAGWDRPGAELPADDMREAIRRLPSQEVPIFDYPGPPAPVDGKWSRRATAGPA